MTDAVSDAVDRAIRRTEIRVRKFAESDAGRAGIAGALIGLVAGEAINGGVRDALGIETTPLIEQRVNRLSSKASYAVARMASALDPGNPVTSGAIGFDFGRELTNPWTGNKKAISTREPEAKAFPEPNEPGTFPRVDRADRFYRIIKKEVPDTDGSGDKYRALGDEMNRIIVEGSHDSTVKDAANRICQGAGSAREKATRIHDWVQQNVKYTYDEDSPYLQRHPDEIDPEWNGALEIFADPAVTLKNRWGDCDDTSTLICAMLRSLGVYGFLRLVSQDHPKIYSHVYPVARLEDGSEFPVDATPIRDGDGWVFYSAGWQVEDVTGVMDIVIQELPSRAG